MNLDTRVETYDTPTPPRLRVEIPKGRIRIVASETAATRIELTARNGDTTAREWIADAVIGQAGDEIMVRVRKTGILLFGMGGSIDAVIHAPLGAEAMLATGAGRIETTGKMGAVRASSGAGVVSIEEATNADVNTGAGDINIGSASGSVEIKTGSGRVRVGTVGADARISTGAGDAEIGEFAGEARMKTAAGDIEVGQSGKTLDTFTAAGQIRVRRADHGLVRAKSLAGGISIGVARGTAALLDVSTMHGRVHSELEPGEEPGASEKQVELVISTMSGNVNVARA